MLPIPPASQAATTFSGQPASLLSSTEAQQLGRFFDSMATSPAKPFAATPPLPPRQPVPVVTTATWPSLTLPTTTSLLNDMSEQERSALMAQQVRDLQSWCEVNRIIPPTVSAPPPPSYPSTSYVSTALIASTSAAPLPIPAPVGPASAALPPAQRTVKRQRSVRPRVKQEEADDDDGGDYGSATPAPSSGMGNGIAPKLLTDAERRANHIASEQKRRAAIRDGYDNLVAVVPALREAVREYEDRLSRARATSSATKRTRRKGAGGAGGYGANAEDPLASRGALTGGIEVNGEKIDGRAGPKSEAVVLTQTVEYVGSMWSQREALLERLARAQNVARQVGFDPLQGAHPPIWSEPWREDAMQMDHEYADAEE